MEKANLTVFYCIILHCIFFLGAVDLNVLLGIVLFGYDLKQDPVFVRSDQLRYDLKQDRFFVRSDQLKIDRTSFQTSFAHTLFCFMFFCCVVVGGGL